MLDKKIQEYEKFYHEIHERLEKSATRYGIIVIIFGIIYTQFLDAAIYVLFSINDTIEIILKITVGLGSALFVYSAYKFIQLLWPRDIAFKGHPKRIYEDTYQKYLDKGYSPEKAKKLLKHSEVELLEESCLKNYSLYKYKRSCYYRTIASAIFALLFLVPSFLYEKLNNFNLEPKPHEVIIMSDDEKTPNPDEIIRIEPEFIKEGKEKPENKSDSDSKKD